MRVRLVLTDVWHWPLFAMLGAGLVLGGCASRPSVATGPGTSISEARRTLLLTAADGPVPLAIDAAPPVLGNAGQVAVQAERGAADYTRVTFTPEPWDARTDSRVRLIFRFQQRSPGDVAAVCTGTAAASTTPSPLPPPDPPRLQATFCDGERLVANAVGIANGSSRDEVASLVRAVTGTLFPGDDFGGGSGFFPGVSVFVCVGGSSGGVGVGVGGVGFGF